jgi:hypothetical protein
VALAFRLGDDRLLAFVEAHPDLADELVAGFDDGRLGAESALVILLAYFAEFDSARNGREDGEVSWDDLWAMTCSPELPPYVAQAAQLLRDNPVLFGLVESSNDRSDNADDVIGAGGDLKISVRDITTFIAFNDQLAVVEQNFTAFDTAGHPGRSGGRPDLAGRPAGRGRGHRPYGRGRVLAAGPRQLPGAPVAVRRRPARLPGQAAARGHHRHLGRAAQRGPAGLRRPPRPGGRLRSTAASRP